VARGPIENPVINSPFVEPAQHFRTSADGEVTGEIVARRRPSESFVPVARPGRRRSAQLTLEQFGPPTRQQPNEIVNEIRDAVGRWRTLGYPHTTAITRELLAYWRNDDRERRLFFGQLEAVETATYLAEAAERLGDAKALNVIRAENERLNGGLPRSAFKLATGAGETFVTAITNFHTFLRREKVEAAALTKKILAGRPVTRSASAKARPRWPATSAPTGAGGVLLSEGPSMSPEPCAWISRRSPARSGSGRIG
jgi:hypothetical protein